MYSLDINFIKDRPEYNLKSSTQGRSLRLPGGNLAPLYLGVAIGVFLPAMVGASWLLLQSQNGRLETEIAELDGELNRLGIQEQEIKRTQAEIDQIRGQTQALASVFNQIRPWSAMLQDLRDRIPTAVQIETIRQTSTTAAPPNPQQSPANAPKEQPPANAQNQQQQNANNASANQPAQTVGGIEISGMARSFNDVNDFLLTLQQSSFLKSTDTRLVTAELTDIATATPQAPATAALRRPQAVRYTIQSSLNDVPASELMRELERKGSLGLVSRIRILQQRGVIQR